MHGSLALHIQMIYNTDSRGCLLTKEIFISADPVICNVYDFKSKCDVYFEPTFTYLRGRKSVYGVITEREPTILETPIFNAESK